MSHSDMVAPDINPHKNFARALKLLRANLDSDACVRFAQIEGWNFSFYEDPLMAAAMWNNYLPCKVRVGHDAFIDKGITPEHLTRSEMEEIQELEGVTNDPMKEGFQPFYTWTFSVPKQSKVYIDQQRKYQEAKERYIAKYFPSNTMEAQRYWGD